MNKIYKVVWSKAKHCYVVTSELAKRNTKGCGARSLRMAAVSLGVAAALLGGFSTTAEAKSVSKVIIDYSGYYVFQHSPKSLTVNQEAIDNVDSWTGNTYAYGNVRRGDSRAVTDVYYTIEDGESVRHSDINIYYGNPADPQSYFPVLTQNPFNDTTVIENNAIQYGTYSTIGEFAKADPDAKKEVTGYSLTLTGKGLTDVAGALSYGGSVSNNSLTVNGGAVTGDVYGGTTTSGDASYNAVTINSGTVSSNTYGKGNVYGGNSYYGNASYNAVTVNGGTVTGNTYSNGNVYGGNTSSGEATYNTVTITGGTISRVYGGNSNLNATNNTVTVQGGTVGSVTGAYSSKEANNNTVNVSKGTVGTSAGSYAVVGAANDGTSSGDPVSSGNHVNVTGTAQVTGLVIGARDAYYAAVITDNTVTIDGSAVVTGDVFGGYGWHKDKTQNRVYVNSGTVTGNVYGVELNSSYSSDTGNATSNEVHISGGAVSGSIYGGAVKGKVSGNANSNRVEITGGEVKASGAGSGDTVYGGYSETGHANSNKVQVSGESIVKLTVYGGVTKYTEGTANENAVTVSGNANLPSGITAGWSPNKDAENNTVTIEGGTVQGYINGGVATGAADNNHIIVNDGTVGSMQGGSGGSSATGNTVEINGGTVTDTNTIFGGNSNAGTVTGNTVTVNKGTVNTIYGGYSNSGTVTNNTVTISDGSINGRVYGGSNGTGDTNGNKVSITGGALSSTVYGGYGYNGVVTGNTVTMTAGQVNSFVYGGVSETKAASSNNVKVSGGKVSGGVIGGRSGKDYGDGHPAVEDVKNNTVEISGDAEVTSAVYGGRITNATANVEDNTVTIKDSSKVNRGIHGGQTNYGNAIHNKVTIEGGTITGQSYGDYVTGGRVSSDSNGKAQNNEVEISGGTVSITVQGGFAQGGETTGNKVTISGGTVTATVEGAYNTGDVANNSVTITGGKLSNLVSGGRGSGSATGNTVAISGGTDSWIIIGGNGMRGATGNTVTISGGDLTVTQDRARPIYGGYTDFYDDSPRDATGNTVNLTGNTTGLETRNIVGGYVYNEGSGDVLTGNELHVGGTKDGSITGTWTGSGDNTLNEVRNFDSIVLHAIDWSSAKAAINATTLTGVNTLDVSKLDYSAAMDGKILLTAGNGLSTDNSNAVSLAYKDNGTDKTATFADLSAGVTFDVVGSGTDVVYNNNGVKVLGSGSKTIKLADINNIIFNITSSVTGIEFGNMTYGTGADLTSYTLADGATLDATPLKFNNPEKASGSMALLSGATGIVSDMPVTAANHTQNFTNTLSNNVKLGATLEGTVTTLAGVVNYTVKDTTVKSVDLSNWNGRSSAVASGWKSVDGGLTVTAAGFTDPKLAAGQTYLDIVTTDTEGFFGSVTGDKAYQGSNLNLDAGNGVLVKGLQASGVKAEESGKKLTYYASVKDVNSIEVSGWDGTEATAVDLTGWNLADGIAVDTDGMAAPGAMAAGDSKTLVEATGANFTGIAVTGAYAWQNEGSLDTASVNGVSVTGSSTGGGVKGDGTKIIYQKSKNAITSLTLGEVDFADKGTARSFGADDDLSSASINADGLSFTNASSLSSGQSMTLVDATGALDTATIANFSDKKYETTFEDKVTNNLTIKGAQTDWLKQNGGTKLVYTVGDRVVSEAAMSGNLAWSDGVTHYTNTNYKFDGNTKVNVGVNFTATADPLAGTTKTMTLLKGATDVAASNVTGTPSFTVTLDQANTTLSANAAGTVGLSGNDVTYAVSGVQLQTVTVKNVGDTADTVPVKWTIADGAAVETDGMAVPEVAAGTHKDILQSNTDHFFANVTVNGANAYKPVDFKEESSGVTLAGSQEKGVTLNSEKNHLIYAVGSRDVTSVTLGNVTWQKDATLVDGSSTDYNYSGVTEITADDFVIMNPEDVAADDSMTLLKANATLQEMAQKMKASYNNYEVAPGVTIDGNITGQMSRSGNNVTFTAAENKASQLTFGDVEWKDSGALLTRPANIVFDGAKVVTTNIKFTNIDSQVADQTMTLVHKFDGTPSAIEGDHYMVGSGRMGEGAAEMNGNDLIFRTKTGTAPTEATHETVMAMEAGTAVVAAGREYVDSAVEGLGLVSNMAPDGTSTFASMGGGVGRYKTGSHVDTHTWSAVVAVGSKREHKKGSLEWGVFAEYGRGNYTLHDDNGGRGDGDTHYAGGGLLAKWTNKHDVYAEASVRLGRMSDSASNMLTDRLGNSYGYDVHANYVGGHVGFGKIYKVQKTKDLDVYGKFFYTRRNGVDFDAGGNHYSLDSVNSSLLRVGARYGSNDRKWNWYGGLAYEYEFGGESKGTVDGLAIRSASIKGASVRGEIGMRMEATKTNPWKVDIGIFGYGGKHRGFGGSVNVAYMF